MCGDQPVLQSKLPPRAFISVHLQPQSCLVLPVKSGQEKNMFGQILFSRFICLLMLLPASAMWYFGAQLHWSVSVQALIGDLKKWYWAELENEENAKKEVVCWKVSALSLLFSALSSAVCFPDREYDINTPCRRFYARHWLTDRSWRSIISHDWQFSHHLSCIWSVLGKPSILTHVHDRPE